MSRSKEQGHWCCHIGVGIDVEISGYCIVSSTVLYCVLLVLYCVLCTVYIVLFILVLCTLVLCILVL